MSNDLRRLLLAAREVTNHWTSLDAGWLIQHAALIEKLKVAADAFAAADDSVVL